jgi:uncharacterized protein
MVDIRDTPAGAIFTVRIHPRARRNAITCRDGRPRLSGGTKAPQAGDAGDALKLSLTAAPVEGKANATGIEFLANLLKVPRSSVTIASGKRSRTKVIWVAGLSAATIRQRLSIP